MKFRPRGRRPVFGSTRPLRVKDGYTYCPFTNSVMRTEKYNELVALRRQNYEDHKRAEKARREQT